MSSIRKVRKAWRILKANGVLAVFKEGVYHILVHNRWIFDLFDIPTEKIGIYNGVAVRDLSLVQRNEKFPEYEARLIAGIREFVREGDRAVIVGGGKGVSTVSTGKKVGPDGSVVTFEGSATMIEGVRETVSLNSVSEIVEVRHAVVGEEINVYEETDEAPVLRGDELPDCDVLVLDCEGAELKVIDTIDQEPRAIVVETHEPFGAPQRQVRERLIENGYEIAATYEHPKFMNVLVGTQASDE